MMASARGWVLASGGTHGIECSGAHGRGGEVGGSGAVQLVWPCRVATATKLLASFEDADIISRTKEGILIHDVNRLDSVGME